MMMYELVASNLAEGISLIQKLKKRKKRAAADSLGPSRGPLGS